MVQDLRANYEEIRDRIRKAAARANRPDDSVRIMAVTKNHPKEAIDAALSVGIRTIGENRVQEAASKIGEGNRPFEFHLIGHLQRNKAKQAASLFDCVQSIDKAATADELAKRSRNLGRSLDIYLEYNTSGEEAKHGVRSSEDVLELVDHVLLLPELRLRGLMTVGPITEAEAEVRNAFRRLARLARRLEESYTELDALELSMGMSGDYELAVEEGATMVRIGSALFGSREVR